MGLLDIILGNKTDKTELLDYFKNHELYSQLTPDGVRKIRGNIQSGSLKKKSQIDKSVRMLVKTNRHTKDKYGKTYF
ncbi:MAG: hypothetical protein BZ137_06230 [Methanosphaera sp. rholeuAM130]|nr:hypothetical protein [Methanosphaera sp.]RAP53664.1 MAG: hypothetical protein BZ137_06230 [Methanosphaera sp. rholeuAM130]